MVRSYKRKRSPIPEEKILEALNQVQSGVSYREAAKRNNISSPSTLIARLKKRKLDDKGRIISATKNDFQSKYSSQQVFSKTEEEKLASYALTCSKMCYGMTYIQFRQLVFKYAQRLNLRFPNSWNTKEMAGEDWVLGFMKRHPELSNRRPENTSLARATSFNRTNVTEFFDKYEKILKLKKFTASQIFNLDETGVATVIQAPKVIAAKGTKQVGQAVSAERGTSITLCMMIRADGNAPPPVFIFPRAKVTESMTDEAPPGSLALANSPKSHWMTGELFLEVLKHLQRTTGCQKAKPEDKPEKEILLLMDNHESHCTLEAVLYARDHGIHMVTFPPHCSHKLQPLDVGVLGPFKSYMRTAQNDWLVSNPGKTISIHVLPKLVSKAFDAAFSRKNIISSFKKPGLWPLDRLVFSDDDFACASVTDRPLQVVENQEPEKTTQQHTENVLGIGPESAPSKPAEDLNRPSTSGTTPGGESNEVHQLTPEDIRPLAKAAPRVGAARGRAKGKPRILTESPEKDRLILQREEKKKKKTGLQPPKATKKKSSAKRLFDDPPTSESDPDEPSEISSSDSEVDLSVNVDEKTALNVNDFILVEFAVKKSKILFVGQIEEVHEEGYRIKFMRRKDGTWNFVFPAQEDSSVVDREDIRLKLPTPSIVGGTARAVSVLSFSVDFSNIKEKIM